MRGLSCSHVCLCQDSGSENDQMEHAEAADDDEEDDDEEDGVSPLNDAMDLLADAQVIARKMQGARQL